MCRLERFGRISRQFESKSTRVYGRHTGEVSCSERIAAHPEITRALGGFEKCPDWVPAMDTGEPSAWIMLKTMGVRAGSLTGQMGGESSKRVQTGDSVRSRIQILNGSTHLPPEL